VVHPSNDTIDISLPHRTEIKSFREDPPQAAIRVLILPALPGVVCVREIHGRTGVPFDELPEREFAPAIVRDDAFDFLMTLEGGMHGIRRAVRDEINNGEQTLSFDMREELHRGRAFDRVALPARHVFGSLCNVAHQASPALFLCTLSAIPMAFLAVVRELDFQVRTAACDPGIDGFVYEPDVVCNDFRRHERVEHALDPRGQHRIVLNLPILLFRASSALPRQHPCVCRMITSSFAVSLQFASNGRVMDAEFLCNVSVAHAELFESR